MRFDVSIVSNTSILSATGNISPFDSLSIEPRGWRDGARLKTVVRIGFIAGDKILCTLCARGALLYFGGALGAGGGG